MPSVTINDLSFDVDLIVFDKDGTLIELDLWGHQLEKWVRLLQKQVDLSETEVRTICAQLGYDIDQEMLRPDTPIVVASIEQLLTIGAFILHQRGMSWTEAEQVVHAASHSSLAAPPDLSMLHMIGDVVGTMKRLRTHDIQIGIATSDDRMPTEKTVEVLGIGELVQAIVCADDPIPMKPAPDGLLHISRELGVPPESMLMVGDSIGDMACGRAAGVAGCIRIGPQREGPTDVADVTITSIEEIVIG